MQLWSLLFFSLKGSLFSDLIFESTRYIEQMESATRKINRLPETPWPDLLTPPTKFSPFHLPWPETTGSQSHLSWAQLGLAACLNTAFMLQIKSLVWFCPLAWGWRTLKTGNIPPLNGRTFSVFFIIGSSWGTNDIC